MESKELIADSNNVRAIAKSEARQEQIAINGWSHNKRKKRVYGKRDELAKTLNCMLAAPVGEHECSIFSDKFEGLYHEYMLAEMAVAKLPVF